MTVLQPDRQASFRADVLQRTLCRALGAGSPPSPVLLRTYGYVLHCQEVLGTSRLSQVVGWISQTVICSLGGSLLHLEVLLF